MRFTWSILSFAAVVGLAVASTPEKYDAHHDTHHDVHHDDYRHYDNSHYDDHHYDTQHHYEHHDEHDSGRWAHKSPHEAAFEAWKALPEEEDHDASYYKGSDEQFKDLHGRLLAFTHHLASLHQQLGTIYDRVDGLHWKDEEMREEARHSRIPREQIDKMEERLKSVETLNMEIAKVITSKDWTAHFEDLHYTIREHHHNLLYTVPQTVSHALTTGAPRMGMLLAIVVLMQVGWAAVYVIYKTYRSSKRGKYL